MIYHDLHYSPVDAIVQFPAPSQTETRAEFNPPTIWDILLTTAALFYFPLLKTLKCEQNFFYVQAPKAKHQVQTKRYFSAFHFHKKTSILTNKLKKPPNKQNQTKQTELQHCFSRYFELVSPRTHIKYPDLDIGTRCPNERQQQTRFLELTASKCFTFYSSLIGICTSFRHKCAEKKN